MKNKILSLLGFAQKSGNLYSGENTCELYIKKNKIKLLIITQDTSENSKNKFVRLCNSKNIPYMIYSNKNELSNAIGKYKRGIFGIKDGDFSKKIMDLYNDGV
ncbi:L7Ae/L30e/S12e/Gadd45 family ribosomal protein [Maledivibacter halophilus]|uniref:Ribosomal protein L7Ae n=1 Tax=Maledivibacter halophilus TaxID=36842 RepID=A0A1T5LDH7_9FIRM|nr:ribosomal L7Ae/L30e/S12e/Gadd45 family protein [Maledivibacter halophilus]SKC74096.1 Ribosomal protein L7Ae [Maledivibacter halophilus]